MHGGSELTNPNRRAEEFWFSKHLVKFATNCIWYQPVGAHIYQIVVLLLNESDEVYSSWLANWTKLAKKQYSISDL